MKTNTRKVCSTCKRHRPENIKSLDDADPKCWDCVAATFAKIADHPHWECKGGCSCGEGK